MTANELTLTIAVVAGLPGTFAAAASIVSARISTRNQKNLEKVDAKVSASMPVLRELSIRIDGRMEQLMALLESEALSRGRDQQRKIQEASAASTAVAEAHAEGLAEGIMLPTPPKSIPE